MNAVANHMIFASAYRQLTPAERSLVDSVVAQFQQDAERSGGRISAALTRPVPQPLVDRARGLLDRPMVKAAITERVNEIAAQQELTIQRTVREMMSIAFSSMGHYMQVDDDGAPVFDLARCTPEQLAAIKSIDMGEVGDGLTRARKVKFKITLHDKIAGLSMLTGYMGMKEADNPHWRADMAQAQAARLPPGATAQEAGDAYAAMLGE